MSRLRIALLTTLLLLGAAFGGEKKRVDGTYTGSARGYRGPVRLSVQIAGGKIAAVRILSQRESRHRNSTAVIPARIVAKQSTEVDAVSGATVTSGAIRRAARRALAKSYGPVFKELPDGTYDGKSKGYVQDVTVRLVIRGGWILQAAVVGHRESRPGAAAREVPAAITDNQSTKVDAVSGATVTSQAIMKAADQALKKAAEAAAEKAKAAEAAAAKAKAAAK